MGVLTDRLRQSGKDFSAPSDAGLGVGQVSEREQQIADRPQQSMRKYRQSTDIVGEREQAIIDRNRSEFGKGSILQRIAQGKANAEIAARQQQREYAEQAPPEMAEPVRDMLSNLGNRARVLEVLRQMTPEQREEALRLAPGIAQQLGDDRGGAVGRTLGAISRGISHGVSQPTAELLGMGGTPEEIEYIRQLDAAASQEFSPARPGDPWYEKGPLQAAEMAPWMATVAGGAGLGRAAATGVAGRLAAGAAGGSRAAGAAVKAGQAAGSLPARIGLPALTAGKAGELAGVTLAAFPSQYAQEVDALKEMGIEEGTPGMRLLAGATAALTGLIEGIVPNPFGPAGEVPLTQGALRAARKYLWESAKQAPGEMSEEYLQGVTSGVGEVVADYLYENTEDKTLADAFKNGWEQAKEAALPMTFLLGVPAVGGAGLSAARARRLSRLQEIRSKGFVSTEDAQQAGIEGKNRKERLANVDAEIKSLETEASRSGNVPPPIPGQQPPALPTEGVTDEVQQGQQGQQPKQGQTQAPTGQVDEEIGVVQTPEEIAKELEARRAQRKAAQSQPEGKENFEDVGKAGGAIVDNFYEGIRKSLNETGKVPGPERKSSVGKAWDAWQDKTDVDGFIEALRTQSKQPKKSGVSDASQVRTDEGRPEGQGDAGQGSQVAGSGQVRVEGQDQGGAEQTGQKPQAPQVPVKTAPVPQQPGGGDPATTTAGQVPPKTEAVKKSPARLNDRVFIPERTQGDRTLPATVGKVISGAPGSDSVTVELDGGGRERVKKEELLVPDATFEAGEQVRVPWVKGKDDAPATIQKVLPDGKYEVQFASGRTAVQSGDQLIKLQGQQESESPKWVKYNDNSYGVKISQPNTGNAEATLSYSGEDASLYVDIFAASEGAPKGSGKKLLRSIVDSAAEYKPKSISGHFTNASALGAFGSEFGKENVTFKTRATGKAADITFEEAMKSPGDYIATASLNAADKKTAVKSQPEESQKSPEAKPAITDEGKNDYDALRKMLADVNAKLAEQGRVTDDRLEQRRQQLEDLLAKEPKADKTPTEEEIYSDAKIFDAAAEQFSRDIERKGIARGAEGETVKIVPDPVNNGMYSLEIVDTKGNRNTLGDPRTGWTLQEAQKRARSEGGFDPSYRPSEKTAESGFESEPQGISYHSGLSRSNNDLDAAIESKQPVGVSLFQSLTAPVRKKLVDYVNKDGRAFIDSGAFTAFTKGKEVDWDRVLFGYHEMLTSIREENRDKLSIVAPDVVGDHEATMELQDDLLEKFQPFLESGATVIVPVQQGGHGSISGNLGDLTNIYDENLTEGFTVGVPYNAKAWSQDDVLEFMRFRDKHDPGRKFHLLGGGPSKLQALFEAAKAEGLSTEGISGDAMPSSISQRKRGEKADGEPPPKKRGRKPTAKKTGWQPAPKGGISVVMSPDLKLEESKRQKQSPSFPIDTGSSVTVYRRNDSEMQQGVVEDFAEHMPANLKVRLADGEVVYPLLADIGPPRDADGNIVRPETKAADKAGFEYGQAVARADDPTFVGRFEGTSSSGDFIVRKDGKRTTWPKAQAVPSDATVDSQGRVITEQEPETGNDLEAMIEAEFDAQLGTKKPAKKRPAKKQPSTSRPKKTGRKTQEPSAASKPQSKLQKAADKARAEADDLWAELNQQAKDKLTSGLDPDLAKLAVRVALAEIKAGTLSFAAFVEATVAKVPANMLDKMKPYMEMSWKVAHKRGMTDDPGGKFDDVLAKTISEQSDEQLDTPRTDDTEALGDDTSESNIQSQENGPTGETSRDDQPADTGDRGNAEESGGRPDADSGGNRDGVSSPAGSLSNHQIGKQPAWLEGGPVTKLNRNIEALVTMQKVEKEGRHATPDEQAVIAQYTGWGHLKQFFIRESDLRSIKAIDGKEWNRAAFDKLDAKTESQILEQGARKGRTEQQMQAKIQREKATNKHRIRLALSMTPAEYAQARKSTRYSHYTDPAIARSMWQFLSDALPGAGKIRVLEPSEGSGMFWGTMPDSMFKRAEMHGIDMDPSSSRVSKHLYPSVRHMNIPYQEVPYPEGFFDVAITNVPFNANPVQDPNESFQDLSLHNYFFAKTAKRLRDGGVIAFVTTHFTMDAVSPKQRQVLSELGLKFLGAVRLNQDAFGNVANTKVTTDIIIMQKVPPDSIDKRSLNDSFGMAAIPRKAPLDGSTDGAEVNVHPYFINNPNMVAGTITANGEMRGAGPELTVESSMTPEETAEFINQALGEIKVDKDAFVAGESQKTDMTEMLQGATTFVPEHLQGLGVGSLAVDGNNLVLRTTDETMSVIKTNFSPVMQARAEKWFAVRDALAELQRLQRHPDNPVKEIDKARKKLNKVYDSFVDKYKPLNTSYNKSMFSADHTSATVQALENTSLIPTGEKDKNGNEKTVLKVEKASIFSERNEWPLEHRPKPKTIREALAHSLYSKGGVDVASIAESLGKTEDEVSNSLEEYAFRVPNDGGWEINEVYLSGNVAKKLQAAEKAAEQDPSFSRNVDALKNVLPVPKSFDQIKVYINSPFMPVDILRGFVSETLGLGQFELSRNNQETGGGWRANYGKSLPENQTTQDREQYAVLDGRRTRRTGFELFVDMLAGKPTVITDTDPDGRAYVNETVTNLAKAKRAEMSRAFDTYIRGNQDRMDAITDSFNSKLSGYVKQEIPDWVVSLDGMSQNWKDLARPYQRVAIAKIALGGNTLLAHRVGYGKTLSGVAGIMEQRRLGVARKPVAVVPNHLTGQWAKAFAEFYPSAKVMAPTSSDFEKSKRQATMSRIMTGNWDAVIIPESSFKKLPMSPEYVEKFFRDQIALAIDATERARAEEGADPRSIAQLEDVTERLRNQMAKYLAESQKDPGPFFDEMGIDSLTVDEAHHYKNLPFYTQNTRIAGINPTGSQQAFDMLMKADFINELTGSRNLTFLTGTPIANSMTEAWVMQRYLMPEAMKDANVFAFDDWKTTFGEVVDRTRVNTIGTGFRTETRFQEFVNLEILSKMFQQVADVQMKNNDVQVPPVSGGKPRSIVVPATDAMKNFMLGLASRSQNMPKDPSEDNMLNVMTVGAGASIDFRLLDAAAMPSEISKLTVAADEISSIFDRTTPFKGTQIIWADRGVPKAAKKLTAEMKQLGAWMLEEVQSRPLSMQEVKDKWKELRNTKGAAKELQRFLGMALQDMNYTTGSAEDEDSYKVDMKDEPTVYLREITDVDPNITEQSPPAWNVYQQMKELLTERGVPADQIVFIHDYKTAAQKVQLWEQMNNGDVRVLIGNTPRLGTGANIQKRLVAAHHLDVPWRPSDVEQRDGRIIRSGNRVMTIGAEKGYAEEHGIDLDGVIINRYVTEGSIDARYWDTNEMKAQMLEDFWSGSPGVSIEELGSTTLSMAEVKAAAVANPLLKKKIELESELSKLEEEYRGAIQSNTQTESRLAEARKEVPEAKEKLKTAKERVKWWDESKASLPKGETFALEIDGKTLFRRDDIGEALEDKLHKIGRSIPLAVVKIESSDWAKNHSVNSSKAIEIGTVFGKPLVVTVEGGFRNRETGEFLAGNTWQETSIGSQLEDGTWERSYNTAMFRIVGIPGVGNLGNNPQGFSARIRNHADPGLDWVEKHEKLLASKERALADLEKLAKELKKPDKTRLLEVEQELEEISNEIGEEDDDQVSYWVATEELERTLGKSTLDEQLGRVDSPETLLGYINHPEHGKLSVFNRAADSRPPAHAMVWVEGEDTTIGYVPRDPEGVMGLPILRAKKLIGKIKHPEHGMLEVFNHREGDVAQRGKVWVVSESGQELGYQDKDKNIVMGQEMQPASDFSDWPDGVKTRTSLSEQRESERKDRREQGLSDDLDSLAQLESGDIVAEARSQAIDIALDAEDAGIKTYDELVAFSVKKLGEPRTRQIGAYLQAAGMAAGMPGVRPTRDVIGMPGVTREQATTFAKAAFPMLTDEQIETGIELQDLTGFGRDEIGFAPFGTPSPGTLKGRADVLKQTQRDASDNVKGWTQFISATRAIIGATDKADVSTFIHEFFHPMRRFLLDRSIPQEQRAGITDKDIQALEDYAGVKDGDWKFQHIKDRNQRLKAVVQAEEKAAKAWEQYWFEGKSPNSALNSLFEKLARWMRDVYRGIQEITGGQLPQEVRDLFDKIVQRGLPADAKMDEPPVEPPSRGSLDQPASNDLTSIKNEVVNELRIRRGMPELDDVAAQTQQEWLDRAEAMLAADPGLGDRIVKEINNKARNLSNAEVAVMQIYYRQVNNQLEEASNRLFAADDAGDPVAKARAQTETDLIMEQLAEIEEATKAAGREWGRAGVARQIVLEKDFSLAAILRKARVANAGNPLSADQQAEMAELAKRVAELEGQLAKVEQEKLDLERQRNIDQGIEDDKKKIKKTVRKSAARQKATAAVTAFRKKFASIFGSSGSTDTLQQTEEERMAEEAEAVVMAYVELGVYSFGEFMANVRKDLGGEMPVQARVAFATAWENAKSVGEIPTPEIDRDNLSGMTRLARRIQRALVESGITERDEVVDAVHESLQELDPSITRRETMDALSGYGQYTLLADGEIERIIRDINGQLQQLAKLEDMRAGQAPAKTGGERRTPSDEERRLIQEVNEAKRRGGFQVTDPAAQLKTALEAAKTATRNRISDLEHEIKTRERIVRTRTEMTPDQELEDLRKRRDALLEVHKGLFPKPGATMAQRIAAANRAVDKAIADIEEQLRTGDVSPKKGQKEPVVTPELEAKRARLEALREQRDAIRALQNPKMTPEQRAEKAYKANLLKQIADYRDRMIKSDFDPKPKKEPRQLSQEELNLKRQLEEVKQEFFSKAADYRLANMSPEERLWDAAKETAHLSRAAMTSIDLSAVFRQGGIAAFSHPILAKQASKEMLGALFSKQSQFDTAEKIRKHKMYQFAVTAGLSITEEEGKITRQEEAYMGRWAKKVPGIKESARAYTTFLNGIRFSLFNHMVSNLKGGQVTADEAKVVARYVNAATGRADLGKYNKAAANMNMVFFAPRYVASRLQYLGMPFYVLGSRKISGRVKKAILAEYARYAISMGSFLSLTVALGSLLTDDDDEKPTVEIDPRSTDFLKLKIGDTRIDPMSGLSQIIVFPSKVLGGKEKTLSGEFRDLRGPGVEYGKRDTLRVIWDFIRSKMAPVPAAAMTATTVDWSTGIGKDFLGEDIPVVAFPTKPSIVRDLFAPLSLREVGDAVQARGVPAGTAISILALLGMGGGTYGSKTEYQLGTEEDREKQFAKDLRYMEWDSPDPAYSEFLTAEQMDRVKQRREERKQDLVYAATAIPDRDDYQSDETFEKAVARRNEAIETLRKVGWTTTEIRQLLLGYWESRYGSARTLKGGLPVLKDAVRERLQQINREFGGN